MEPAFKCRATQARVFLLNLFDLRNKETVLENIIIPLTDEVDLDEILTIPRHPIPGTGGA